eukprot:COSAG01_NODE_6186_length_3804_cov_2.263428_4_plen_82_part_00
MGEGERGAGWHSGFPQRCGMHGAGVASAADSRGPASTQVEALAASQPSAEVSVIEQPDYCMGEYAKTLAILPTSPTLSSTV